MSYTVAVLTISDKGAAGERVDTSGPAVCQMAEEAGYEVVYKNIIPDDKALIQSELVKCADQLQANLILATGGTGFSPRDITPEAALAVIERETPGIPEAMRIASLKITPKGCLSRSVAGIRGGSLIITLPGSKKAATENLEAVIGAVDHGLEMLASSGSANCAENEAAAMKREVPSMDQWLKEAKKDPAASKVGMYLVHNGTVRETAKNLVRNHDGGTRPVKGLIFSYNKEKVHQAVEEAKNLEGIYYVRLWLNEGELELGEDIMYVMVGGDIRPRVIDALNFLVGKIKSECVTETEVYE